jgi:ABC-2 type transport system permease protein
MNRSERRAEGFVVRRFKDEAELAAAVSEGRRSQNERSVSIGLAFPENFVNAVLMGERTVVTVYVDAAVPGAISNAMSSAIREAVYGMRAVATGSSPDEALPVTMPEERRIILGEDRSGNQVPLREKMRPLLAVMVLMIEALALAGLIALEIEHRTVTALLVTPARTSDVLLAKGITGTVLGFCQGLLFLAVTRSLNEEWIVVVLLMFLGAVMMSAVGMISGSAGRDFMSTLFLGMAFILPLMIPAIAAVFPGSATIWVRVLPSYGLIEAMVGILGYGRGLRDVLTHVGSVLAWDILLFGAAFFILKRRVEAL